MDSSPIEEQPGNPGLNEEESASPGNGAAKPVQESPQVPSGPQESKAPSRREWLFLASVCLLCLVYWCFHYHQFTIASPDSYSFVRTARQMWSGELPRSFKRMPLFPLLAGLLAKALPAAEEPELEAGLILNVIFSVGILIFLYLLARRLVGWAAVIPLLFLATSKSMHEMAGQPLVEPIMGFTTLLSFWLFARKSKWAYLAAGLAALTRYECSALIAIFFVLDWIYDRKFWKPLLLSASASSGFLLWMFMSWLKSRSGGNPYVEQINEQGLSISLAFAWEVLDVSFERWVSPAWGLAAFGGMWIAWKRCRRESAAMLAFAVLYTIAHMVFAVVRSRYVYPIRWVLPLFVAVGLVGFVDFAAEKWRERWKTGATRILIALLTLPAVGAGIYCLRLLYKNDGVAPHAVYFVLAIGLFGASATHLFFSVKKPAWAYWALSLALIAAIAPSVGSGISDHADASWSRKYKHYGSYLAGKWLKKHLKPGEKALVPNASLTKRVGQLDKGLLLKCTQVDAETPEELARECTGKGIVYVIYQYYRLPKKTDPRYPLIVRRNKPLLMERFKNGESVPGFTHVVTLEIPKEARRRHAQIYRVNPVQE